MLDAEVRIGELMRRTEKAVGGDRRSETFQRDTDVTLKTATLRQAGFTGTDEAIRQTAHRYETLAAHPETVERAKAEARERGEVVSRTAVMRQIAAEAAQKPENRPKSDFVEAKMRHDAIQQADIVSMDEIRQDKADRHTIAREFYRDLLSATNKAISAAIWNNPDDIDDLMEVIPDDSWPHFCEQIEKTIYLLSRIKERRNEWKLKVSGRLRRRQ